MHMYTLTAETGIYSVVTSHSLPTLYRSSIDKQQKNGKPLKTQECTSIKDILEEMQCCTKQVIQDSEILPLHTDTCSGHQINAQ